MRRATHAAVTLGLIVTAACWSACANRATVDRTSSQGVDPEGNRTSTTGSSITFHESPSRAQLARAKSLASQGQFDAATGAFQALYTDMGAPEEVRAEALLRWAQCESNLLNPAHDLGAAIAHLRLFEETFPESPLQAEARAELDRLQAQSPATAKGQR